MTEPVLPQSVSFLISRLNEHGHRADIVGGCVRDYILGNAPSDYDITTSALPEEMREIFSDLRTVDTGIKHGTLTVLVDGEPFEITTYRTDGEYLDHRHPAEVAFTKKITDDLCRRDFTMNAIAYNPIDGFTDLFYGSIDISNSIIRAVGDAGRRFSEDALRILRAVRFSSVLNFDIESETASQAIANRQLLSSVSGERIAVEWKKLLGGVRSYSVIYDYSDIFIEFLSLNHIRLPEKGLFDSAAPEIRELSLFALSSSDPVRDFTLAAHRMRYDNKRKNFGVCVLENAEKISSNTCEKDLKRILSAIGEEYIEGIIELHFCLGNDMSNLRMLLDKIREENQPYRISDLKITGRDVIALGIKGENVGVILRLLLDSVIDGKIKNTPEELMNAAQKLAKSNKGN